MCMDMIGLIGFMGVDIIWGYGSIMHFGLFSGFWWVMKWRSICFLLDLQ